VIQFANRKIRNATLSQRKNLKGKGITVTEQLTTRRAQLLRKSSDLVASHRLEGAWSHEGKVIIKTLSGRTTAIKNEQDLINY
jgi:hypothetical protein